MQLKLAWICVCWVLLFSMRSFVSFPFVHSFIFGAPEKKKKKTLHGNDKFLVYFSLMNYIIAVFMWKLKENTCFFHKLV